MINFRSLTMSQYLCVQRGMGCSQTWNYFCHSLTVLLLSPSFLGYIYLLLFHNFPEALFSFLKSIFNFLFRSGNFYSITLFSDFCIHLLNTFVNLLCSSVPEFLFGSFFIFCFFAEIVFICFSQIHSWSLEHFIFNPNMSLNLDSHVCILFKWRRSLF